MLCFRIPVLFQAGIFCVKGNVGIDNAGRFTYNESARKGRRVDTNARRLLRILRKEVRTMRITFHIGKYTVTIIVYERKKSSRHSAK